MSALQAMRDELEAAATALAPITEGFRDLARTLTDEDGPEVRAAVQAAIGDHSTRTVALTRAAAVLAALEATGYPAAVIVQMAPGIAAKAQAQGATIAAALAAISTPGEATTASVDLGTITPR